MDQVIGNTEVGLLYRRYTTMFSNLLSLDAYNSMPLMLFNVRPGFPSGLL
jgi:hypothetical protein